MLRSKQAIVLWLAFLLGGVPLIAESGTSAEREIRDVMAQLKSAALRGDSDATAALMTDEYFQTDISGQVQDKQTWFNNYFNPLATLIKTGKFKWSVYDRKNLRIQMYGDCAVVVGDLELRGKGAKFNPQSDALEADPDGSVGGTLHFTHVYVRQNGRWLLAALHNAMPLSPATAK